MATRKFTSVAATPASAAATPAGSEVPTQSMFANPVLTRRAPQGAAASWPMLVPLGVLIVLGAGYWTYTQMRPAPLLDNSAVASAPSAAAVVQPIVPATPAPSAAAAVDQSAAQPVIRPVAPATPVRRYAESARARAPVHHRAASSDTASSTADTTTLTAPPPLAVTPPPATTVPDAGPVIDAPPPSSGTP